MRTISFAKGHGTRNDFVLLPPGDGSDDLSAADVAFLCDRRAGIGADGVLRAVPADAIAEWTGPAGVWFMDYRNADGSIAEMCGNGLRVLLRYLAEEGLVDSSQEVPIGTRSGLRTGTFLLDGRIAVTMGPVDVGGTVTVRLGERSWQARKVVVGNPHAVSVLASTEQLEQLDLTRPPSWEPNSAFPTGVNAEFVAPLGPGHVRLRVFERGVGETASCGTGVVAAAAAMGGGDRYRVDVPGGRLEVDLSGTQAVLTGPAQIVARGSVDLPDQLGAASA